MKKIILLLLIPSFCFSMTNVVDTTGCIYLSKPVNVQANGNGFAPIIPTGILNYARSLVFVYSGVVVSINSKCTILCNVSYTGLPALKTFLQSQGIDSGSVTQTAYTSGNY